MKHVENMVPLKCVHGEMEDVIFSRDVQWKNGKLLFYYDIQCFSILFSETIWNWSVSLWIYNEYTWIYKKNEWMNMNYEVWIS